MQVKVAKQVFNQTNETLSLTLVANFFPVIALIVVLAKYEYVLLVKEIGYFSCLKKLIRHRCLNIVVNEVKRLEQDIEEITLSIP